MNFSEWMEDNGHKQAEVSTILEMQFLGALPRFVVSSVTRNVISLFDCMKDFGLLILL